MTKATKKKTPPAAPPKGVTSGIVQSASGAPPVLKQPQSKQQAAVKAAVFLHTDDQWSQAYFNDGDLHCLERELFG